VYEVIVAPPLETGAVKPTVAAVDPVAIATPIVGAPGTASGVTAVDAVDVAYMKFLNPARQIPVVETILPFAKPNESSAKAVKKNDNTRYEFLPSAEEILAELLPQAFKASLFKCFLDAAVSEQIGRRVTMKAATENADDMIKAISLLYNRARQAQITKEISEIIGGAAALE
jgi:F-type H+-transporting ATPase subunit gamma